MLLHLYFNHVVKMRVLSLLFSALLSFANSQNFYVIPSDGSQDCPPGEECHQLSYYADHSSMLLPISNLTFFNGEHILGKEVTLSGFDTLLLQGVNGEWSEGPHESTMQSSVIIRCTNDSIIAFNITFTQKLELISLTVAGCKTAFSLNDVTELFMYKMSIQNSTSFGLSWEFYNNQNPSNVVEILESSFYQNCQNGFHMKCCHSQLIMNEIYNALYNITYSNFSFGNNFYAGLCLKFLEPYSVLDESERLLEIEVFRCLFLNNTGSKCGGLLLEATCQKFACYIFISESVFLGNKLQTIAEAANGGMTIIVGIYHDKDRYIGISNSLFKENSGGGGYIEGAGMVSIVHSEFTKNSDYLGAGLTIYTDSYVQIVNTSISYSTNFIGNLPTAAFYINCIASLHSKIFLFVLVNVTISNNSMSGIYAIRCEIQVIGTSLVSNNTAISKGGGLWLGGIAVIYSIPARVPYPGGSWNPKGRIIFHNNRAVYGGAIFSDANPFPNSEYQLISELDCSFTNLDAIFVNNTADIAGNDIFGGQYYNCTINPLVSPFNMSNYFFDSYYSCNNETFPVFSHFNKPISLSVSSEPLDICLCTDAGITDCTIRSIHGKVYPGSVITLSLAAIGMCGGIIPDAVVITTHNINVTLGNTDQRTDPWVCKKFIYLLRQVDQYVQNGYIFFHGNRYSRSFIIVGISFLECPPGLYLDSSGSCDCNPVIGSVANVKCNVSWADTPVRRSGNIWLTFETNYNCTIANENCPFDYCNSSTLYLSLDNPDTQCMHNRSGTLCGGCRPGLSLMLGSNRCYFCNNNYLSLLIVFILAGIALVAFLLVLNMTVSVGSINGLLLSANVVKLNEVVFFPNGAKLPVLNQFIAWLNLDFGIETCFFNGLDGYWKTWLQFVFPIYIWLLIGAIIIGSHYSGRLSRVFGNNTVPVLATLILMSYSKLLRTITNALMITNIKCEEKEWSVWSVDANIYYFSYKHSFLFGVSVLFLLVGLLYGGMVFSAQWLQKCTGRYCKSSRDPMVKLKPLVDSYTGPYKDKYRFWTGLLIFIRVLLTALFSYTTQAMPEINNYIIVAVCVFLIRVSATGVYRNAALNNLEFLHYLNLFSVSLLSALSQLQWINARLYLSSVSVCMSMILFISTILVHIHIKIEAKYGKKLCFKWNCLSISNEENCQKKFYSDKEKQKVSSNCSI